MVITRKVLFLWLVFVTSKVVVEWGAGSGTVQRLSARPQAYQRNRPFHGRGPISAMSASRSQSEQRAKLRWERVITCDQV